MVHTRNEQTSVAGKGILITGGTTGIGRAVALLLAREGARIFTFGRHKKELDDAMRDFKDASEPIHATTADASRIEDVRRVFTEAEEKLGGIDILINNAALGAEGILDMKWEDAEYVVRSNLLGYMGCAQEAAKRMKAGGGGHIVNVGSMSADVREKDSSVYVATKSAIQGFSESLRKELNEHGIKVTLIEPGAVGTDMQTESGESVPEQRRKIQSGEMLKAEDIARCIHFCLTQPQRCDVVVVQIRPHKQAI